MRNAIVRFARILLVGVPVAVLAHTCAGCDGGPGVEGADADAGRADAGGTGDVQVKVDGSPIVRRTAAGRIYCDVPSPTGDQLATASNVPARENAVFFETAGDVAAACEAYKKATCTVAPPPEFTVWTGPCVDLVPGLAGVDCRDPANDYRGTSGLYWSVVVEDRNCMDSTGLRSCVVKEIGQMMISSRGQPTTNLDRTYALCSSITGAFVGWLSR